MTVYELAKTLGKEQMESLEKNGILAPNICRYVYIYEMWKGLVSSGMSKTDAYDETGRRCYTCDENIRKIIYKMQKEIK